MTPKKRYCDKDNAFKIYFYKNSYVGGADSVADEATRNRPGEVQKEVKIAAEYGEDLL